MIKQRYGWLGVVLALFGALVVAPFSGVSAATKDKNFLKNMPVTGTLADGGQFKGKVSVTRFGYDPTTGLWVSGRVIGTATRADGTVVKDITQPFSQVHATLNETSGAGGVSTQQEVCDILFLNLGPLHLDLLGLTVDLSEITLDINAVPGPGNLLGNLLCAIAGLLDPNGILDGLLGPIAQLLQQLSVLLNRVNGLL